MEFGRVYGRATLDGSCGASSLRIVIMLETGARVVTVREECVPAIRPVADLESLAWHADQYTQETIGNELALQGWEAIAESAGSEDRGGVDRATVTYLVRRV